MRRLQSFPAPVASISGLQDQLQQTDWTVEDGELCFLRPTRQLFEFRKGVTSPAANGITTVQAALPGVVGQWALLADSDQNVVYFSPQGGGADDWPALNTLMAAVAGQKTIVFAPGSYVANTPGLIPSNTTLVMGSGVTITANIAGGSAAFSVFYGVQTTNVTTTTMTVDPVVGSNQITVTSILAPPIVVGSEIMISDAVGLRAQIYTVLAESGAGNRTLTLDRAIVEPWASGTAGVLLVTYRPRNIQILANGATITGTAFRSFSISAAKDSLISGLNTSIGGSFDIGGYRNRIVDSTADRLVAGTGTGFTLESNEESRILRCYGFRWEYGLTTQDCWDSSIEDSAVSACTIQGISNRADGPNAGSTDCSIVRCYAGNCIGGAGFVDQSLRSTFQSCVSVGNTYGIIIDTMSSGSRVRDMTIQSSTTYDMWILRGVDVSGLKVSTIAGVSLYGPNFSATDVLSVRDFSITGIVSVQTFAAQLVGVSGTKLEFYRGTVTLPGANSVAFHLTGASVRLYVTKVAGTGGTASYGIAPQTATSLIRVGAEVDLSGYATPFFTGNGQYNFGQFNSNNATPVVVPFLDLKANDLVKLTRTANGGTPSGAFVVTQTVGTGFSFTGTNLDTSTFSWQI